MTTDTSITKEDEAIAFEIARAVMVWGAPHLKHMVSFNTLCEAIEPIIARHRDAEARRCAAIMQRVTSSLGPAGDAALAKARGTS